MAERTVHASSKMFFRGHDQSITHVTRRDDSASFGLARMLSGYQTKRKEIAEFVAPRIDSVAMGDLDFQLSVLSPNTTSGRI